MSIRALIVDDEPLARTGVAQLIEPMDDVTVVGEAADGAEAVREIEETRPDLVFLDVQMPERSGLEVVREVGVNEMPVTIFVTAYDEYAIDAFDAHALDYLLKPIDKDRFADAVDWARTQIQQAEASALSQQLKGLLQQYDSPGEESGKAPDRFTVRSRNRIYFVDVDEVQWIESEGDYVALHDGEDVHLIRKTMKELEKRLSSNRFVRDRRSYIVNTEYGDERRSLRESSWWREPR